MRGKARRATDTSVVVSVRGQDGGRTQPDTGTDGTGGSGGAHRSQGIADIEGEVVRRSAEEHDDSNQTQGHATQGETIMQQGCFDGRAAAGTGRIRSMDKREGRDIDPENL